MENVIPSLVIGAMLIVASSITAQSSLRSYDDLSQSMKAMETRLSQQSQTRISVRNAVLQSDAAGVSEGWHRLTLDLTNDGQTRITALDRLDVIVTYYDTATSRGTSWVPYTDLATTPNTWTVTAIDDDTYEPGILNPGETAHIEIKVSPRVWPLRTNLVVISTETGAVASIPFTS